MDKKYLDDKIEKLEEDIFAYKNLDYGPTELIQGS